MAAYLVVDYEVHGDGLRAYGQAAKPLIAQHGGVYRALAGDPAVLEGDPPLRALALIEFPSMERLRAFWDSPEYAEIKQLRAGKATITVRAVEGR